jgi:hypothetical protein
MLNALIQPTHNLLILCAFFLKKCFLRNLIFDSSFKIYSKLNLIFIFYFYICVSQAGFFSQGNSNSLNTIQISSGFVGINKLNEAIVALLLFGSTYASKIYWLFNTAEFCHSIDSLNVKKTDDKKK